jgi:hypothetical protein
VPRPESEKVLPDSGTSCQSLRAACARAETAPTGLAKTGAWLATASDVYAADIGLLQTGPAGARIGIREVTTPDVCGRRAQAPSAFRISAVAVVISGGGIDPVNSSGSTLAIGHLQPPGMT